MQLMASNLVILAPCRLVLEKLFTGNLIIVLFEKLFIM